MSTLRGPSAFLDAGSVTVPSSIKNNAVLPRAAWRLPTLALFVLTLFFPLELLAEAPAWIMLTKNASETVIFYIDAESIHYEGDRVTFWDKREVSDDPTFNEMRGYNEVDCKEEKYRTLRITGYDKNGKSYTDSADGHWQHIEADTAMVAFYHYVCKK